MSSQMIVRIDPELKTKFTRFVKAEGKNTSQVVRELLEAYVKDRDIGSYIDDLWQRIGNKIGTGKVGPAEIQRVIQQVRTQK